MQLTKTHKIIISVIVAIVLFGLYIVFNKNNNGSASNLSGNNGLSTTTDSSGSVSTQGTGSYKIEQVPISEGKEVPKPIPDLNRTITLYNGAIVSPEAKTVAAEKIKNLQTVLKANPAYVEAWIDLGIYQKMAGDYDGAIISWKYASKLSPTDYVSLADIGNLYAYFLKDNAQGEIYYKQAIAKGPTQAYLYIQLSEIYRDIFKDNQKALAIINSGLVKIPNDPSLLEAKTNLSK